MLQSKKKIKILDFDIENRPLSYWIADGKPTAEITAISSCWIDDPTSMETHLLGYDTLQDILNAFVSRYNEADMVVGHFIRKHDLPMINGALLELGMPQLGPKLTTDTRLDMRVKGDIPATQEYLSELFELPLPKIHMSQVAWRESNRLTDKGLALTKTRSVGDVYQNILLYKYMVKHNFLKGPKVWRG